MLTVWNNSKGEVKKKNNEKAFNILRYVVVHISSYTRTLKTRAAPKSDLAQSLITHHAYRNRWVTSSKVYTFQIPYAVLSCPFGSSFGSSFDSSFDSSFGSLFESLCGLLNLRWSTSVYIRPRPTPTVDMWLRKIYLPGVPRSALGASKIGNFKTSTRWPKKKRRVQEINRPNIYHGAPASTLIWASTS